MLSSNWKALLASNKVVQTTHAAASGGSATPTSAHVGTKRKADAMANGGGQAAAASSSHSAAAASGPAIVTPCLAIDCEFVGVGADGLVNALARVSLVNFHGQVVYDKFVKPAEQVTDFRTAVSGIRPGMIHSKAAVTFKQAQREVSDLIQDRILVGHALQNDLTVLLLSHPRQLIRDTSKYKGLCPDRPRSLKKLVAEFLHRTIQTGEHNSIEDARATLALYKHCRVAWEKDLYDKQTKSVHVASKAKPAAAREDEPMEETATASKPAASASSSQPRPSHKPHPGAAQTAESREARNIERNQRRKKMRKEQKVEKNNW